MAASVKARLLNIAKKEKINFNQVLLLYFQERLLYRLSVSTYKEKFYLKGGLLILSLTDFKTRPTKDMDFLASGISNDVDYIKDIFYQICKIKVNDGVTYNSQTIKAEIINEAADYEGVRLKIKSFLGSAEKLLQLDIGFNDTIIPKPRTLDYPVFLDHKNPVINTYSLESVIAEKFEAMLRLSNINSRMKDFYDIFIISDSETFDGRVLQTAIFTTLQKRGTPIEKKPVIFTKKFINNDRRKKMWQGFLKRIGKDNIEFFEVMKRINNYLQPIYKVIINEKEFFKKWNYKKGIWE